MAEAPSSLRRLSPMQRTIALRMTEATQSIPHFRAVVDLNVEAVMAQRVRVTANSAGDRVSLNDLLIKACASALLEVPEVNAQWTDDGIRQFHGADIAVVTALSHGLSTPIIRSAELKSVQAIAAELRELIERARTNKLRLEEVFGGSFSISNLGMHGVAAFDAIINAPQCAILAVGAVSPRMTVADDGAPKVARMMTVTLSADHRAIDGLTAARFLRALQVQLDAPERLFAPVASVTGPILKKLESPLLARGMSDE